MKEAIDKASIWIALASVMAMLLILVFDQDGRRSFWHIPLGLVSIAAILAGSAFGGRKQLIPRHISQVIFWLSLIGAIAMTLIGGLDRV